MIIKFTAPRLGSGSGKLADVALHFTDGPLEGLKLEGLAVWRRRDGVSGFNVTFPADRFQRATVAILRPSEKGDNAPIERLTAAIVAAYREHAEPAPDLPPTGPSIPAPVPFGWRDVERISHDEAVNAARKVYTNTAPPLPVTLPKPRHLADVKRYDTPDAAAAAVARGEAICVSDLIAKPFRDAAATYARKAPAGPTPGSAIKF